MDRFDPALPPPAPTGAPQRAVDLTNKLLAWSGSGPVVLEVPGSPHLYLAVFSTEKQLREVHARAGASLTIRKIKRITDGRDFLASLPRKLDDQELKVMVDPWFLPNGRLRWVEVKLN